MYRTGKPIVSIRIYLPKNIAGGRISDKIHEVGFFSLLASFLQAFAKFFGDEISRNQR